MLLEEILYIAQYSAITHFSFRRQQAVHARDSFAVTDDVKCEDLREPHFKCAIKVPIRVIWQPTQPLVRSKHNGTIHLRSRIRRRNAHDNYRASVREDVGQASFLRARSHLQAHPLLRQDFEYSFAEYLSRGHTAIVHRRSITERKRIHCSFSSFCTATWRRG